MELPEFIATPYPSGLGTTVAIVEKLIAGNERVRLAWDRAIRESPGNPNRDATTGRMASPSDDNIHNRIERPDRPTGTSADAGLRRLDKAAQRGDQKAAMRQRCERGSHQAKLIYAQMPAHPVLGNDEPARGGIIAGEFDEELSAGGSFRVAMEIWRRGFDKIGGGNMRSRGSGL
jgi:hypothetical protein